MLEEVGLEIPEAINAAWDLWPENEPYYRAFNDLSPGRDWISMGLGGGAARPISFVEKRAYAAMYGFDRSSERLRHFLRLIAVQDDEYLIWVQERNERHAAKSEPNTADGAHVG